MLAIVVATHASALPATAFGPVNVVRNVSLAGLSYMATPQAAPAPGGWLVAWAEANEGQTATVRAALLDTDGHPRADSFVMANNQQRVTELSRGPAGWLMVTLERYSEGDLIGWTPHLWLLESAGAAATEIPLGAGAVQQIGEAIKVVASPEGWLVAWSASDGSIRATRLSPSGELVDETLLGAKIPYGEAVAAARHGDSYRIFLTQLTGPSSISVVSRDVPIRGEVADAAPAVLYETNTVLNTKAACSPDACWLLGYDDYGLTFHSEDVAQPWHPPMGSPFMQNTIVAMGGVALVGLGDYSAGGNLQMGLAAPGGELELIDSLDNRWYADLSEPSGNHTLLAFYQPLDPGPGLEGKIATSLVTVGDPPAPEALGSAGAGGAGAAGEAASGAAATAGGDGAQTDGGAAGAAARHVSRTSGGCAFGPTSSGAAALPVLLLMLLGARRRRAPYSSSCCAK